MAVILRTLEELPDQAQHGAVSIGNFDGVHIGHAAIVRRLTQLSRRLDGPSVVFTFDPHPLAVLAPDQAPVPLTWPERKATLLGQLGVDFVVSYPTDRELLQLTPEMFFDRVLQSSLRARGVVEGADFRFGSGRSGDRQLLERLCAQHQVALEIVPSVAHGGEVVSSSRVRALVAAGHIQDANQLLVEPYRIRGVVVEGARRGRQLGFPTANLDQIPNLIPRSGVYAGQCWHGESHWKAAIHIGPNPTFKEVRLKVEVHLLDCDCDIYGEVLEVEFQQRIRDVVTFDSVEELRAQLDRDIAAARDMAETS